MNARFGLAAVLFFVGLAAWLLLQGAGVSLDTPVVDQQPAESMPRAADPDAAVARVEVEDGGGDPRVGVGDPTAAGPQDPEPTVDELRERSRSTEPGVVEGLVLVGRIPLATGGRVLHVPGYLVTMRGPDEVGAAAPEPTAEPIDGNGEFRLHGLAPGWHTIAADLGRGPRQATSFEVVEGQRGRRIVIVLGTARVFGQLWEPQGRPLAGARVTLSRSADHGMLRPFATSCVSSVEGRYEVDDLPAGEWWFAVEPQAASAGAVETMQKISLAVGEVRRLDVGSPAGAAIVRGRVLLRDGSPARGGGLLHLQRKSDRAYAEVAVDAAGAFAAPVAAGEHAVAVTFHGCNDLERWQAMDLAVGRADVAQDFVVGAVQVDGALTAAATGLPPEGIDRSQVFVRPVNGGTPSCIVPIDRTGRFVVGGLRPGRYRLAVHPAALERGPHELEVGAEQVVIPLALTIRGR